MIRLFGGPGCFAERDISSFFGAEQIDIAVGNPRLPEGLAWLSMVLLVECLDWARPVDSKTVGYFINILAGRSVEAGILNDPWDRERRLFIRALAS